MDFLNLFYWFAMAAAVFGPPLTVFLVLRLRRRGWPGRAWMLAGSIAAAWLFGVWCVFIEPNMLVVRQVAVSSPLWSGPPVRLGLIADSHVGAPAMSAARMAKIVTRMNDEHPDLVLLLGDYVGGHAKASARSAANNAEVMKGIETFKGLRAPLGAVGILGNHDLWYNLETVHQALSAAHVTVLDQAGVLIHRPQGDFWVAGLPEYLVTRPWRSARQVFATAPVGVPSILMAHEPDGFIVPNLPYAFMAAGHTHCGQVRLPVITNFAIGTYVERKLSCHLYVRGDQSLYVSAGLGESGLPMRFRAPPELDIITLSAAPK
jgi:predicted MPP superfamily phosphohydrolase